MQYDVGEGRSACETGMGMCVSGHSMRIIEDSQNSVVRRTSRGGSQQGPETERASAFCMARDGQKGHDRLFFFFFFL